LSKLFRRIDRRDLCPEGDFHGIRHVRSREVTTQLDSALVVRQDSPKLPTRMEDNASQKPHSSGANGVTDQGEAISF
jgi:hypothetical protein